MSADPGGDAPVSVLVADDQDLVRVGLRALISAEPSLHLAGEAADGLEAVALARRLRPDVVLMDIRMPGIDGIEATRRIVTSAETSDTTVIVLTTFEHDEYVVGALRAGAAGFLLKDTRPAELVAAIHAAGGGGAPLSPTVSRTVVTHLTSGLARQPRPHPRLDSLTPREVEVVRLVADGLTNDEIAQHLVMSPATVRTHVSRAMTKLGAHDRARLVVIAYQSGLV